MIELMLQAERALMVGMVDQAERLYLMASRNDPLNAIAVVGLARVALERNDDRAAYDLSRDALAIDPDNAAALRLEARLSEVLTHRGEEVERPEFVLPGGPGTGATPEGKAARKKPAAEPFPPAPKRADEGGLGPLGTVMGDRRPGWQPSRMPDVPATTAKAKPAPMSRPAAMDTGRAWSPPGWAGANDPSTSSAAAASAAQGSKAEAPKAQAPKARGTEGSGVHAGRRRCRPRDHRGDGDRRNDGPWVHRAAAVPDPPEQRLIGADPIRGLGGRGGDPGGRARHDGWRAAVRGRAEAVGRLRRRRSRHGESTAATGDGSAPIDDTTLPTPAPAAEPERRSFLRRLFGR